MIHIKATITFDKDEDGESLQTTKETLFTYNLFAMQVGARPITYEICDCGDTQELRFDFDYIPDEDGAKRIFNFINGLDIKNS